ncbi:MAG: type IV secretory system conjugative DNA transfer family protein [Lachnoclostridium sp.]|nr:type IV secretory system conjugative DNA transfer family protein [Lachnospira sp.]MCM1248013.1 type IV secretory system conjugative DNA transfer family protein [Lachnoclostridium sp.]
MNVYDYFSKGKKDFTPNLSFKKDVMKVSDSKRQAMYKQVSSNDGLLSNKAEGLIFGKQGSKYVTLPVGKEGTRDGVSAIILGSPGSGKSVFLTNFLLNNFQQKKPTPVFCLDIKPELARKSVPMSENKNVKVVDFTDRNKAGWDVYFAIDKETKDDEKIRVFDGIARALITNSNPKDKFFVNNARTILKFLLLYWFNKGLGFIDSITKVLSEDAGEHIKKVLEDKEFCPDGSLVYNGLKKYEGKDSEAMQDIVLTLQEHLNIFLNSDIRYQLRDNSIKACPEDLNRGNSVFVCLPMYLLDEYEDLLRLLVYQTISTMERRGEDWKQGAVLILDELARLGRLENLLSFLAVNRSLGVSVLMAYQDFSQIEKIYSKEEARTLMNLSEVTYVLSCKDNETTKILSDLIGEYQEEKVSHNRSELLHCSTGKENVSSEYRKIMEVADFQSLRERKEAILIVYGKYFRVKQFRYFEHPAFLKRYNEVIESNKNYENNKVIKINDKGE